MQQQTVNGRGSGNPCMVLFEHLTAQSVNRRLQSLQFSGSGVDCYRKGLVCMYTGVALRDNELQVLSCDTGKPTVRCSELRIT